MKKALVGPGKVMKAWKVAQGKVEQETAEKNIRLETTQELAHCLGHAQVG